MADDLRETLGIPQECNGFTDKKVRIAYPVTMYDFPTFIGHARFVNPKALWNNMLFDEGVTALKYVMEKSFQDEDVTDVMKNINAGNFVEIIQTILEINGIPKTDEVQEKNVTEV